MDSKDLSKIKEIAEEFFRKTTISIIRIDAECLPAEKSEKPENPVSEVVALNVKMEEPQIFIGEKGQTLFEIQRLLRTMLNKKLQKIFYLDLDINEYKKKKSEYLKEMAKDLADEVALTREEKIMHPMPAYERRIIHAELSQRTDVATESQGEGKDRHIVIKPK